MADLYIGLMSGTSLDGIDAALVTGDTPPRLLHHHHQPFPTKLRERLLALAEDGPTATLDEMGRLDVELGQQFAGTVSSLLERAGKSADDIRAIGSHGQTVRHHPEPPHGFTLQIGDPNCIAAHTGITTVADFRRRDIALGGQGAPLVPAFHQTCFAAAGEARAVLNIGGMANLTLLHQDPQQPVTGFDTGPGNVLLDGWFRRHRQGAFDQDGSWAASGTVQDHLLARLLADEYFILPPPKSTGRERFHLQWLDERLDADQDTAAEDVQATLAEFTAASIADALKTYAPDSARLLVCGGGIHNTDLLKRLQTRLPGIPVESTAHHGLEPDWVEAIAFAWLAQQTLAGRPGNAPAVTGASAPAILGGIYPGRHWP